MQRPGSSGLRNQTTQSCHTCVSSLSAVMPRDAPGGSAATAVTRQPPSEQRIQARPAVHLAASPTADGCWQASCSGGRGGIYETCFPSSDTPLCLENSEPGLGPSPGTDCTMPPQHTPRSPTWAPPALPGAGTQPLNALNSCADSQQINIKDGRLQRVL